MKEGDIVKCLEYGMALILGPCEIPQGVPEEKIKDFLDNPDAWPTEPGWTVQLLELDNKILDVNVRNLKILSYDN